MTQIYGTFEEAEAAYRRTDAAYQEAEARAHARHIEEITRAPRSERKAARAEYAEAMRNPSLIRERLGWLLAGNYGHGAMAAARRIVTSSARGNRVAALSQQLAAVEWLCPGAEAREAWYSLSEAQRAAIDAVFAEVLA